MTTKLKLVLVLSLAACDTNNYFTITNPDASVSTTGGGGDGGSALLCTPNAKECVTTSIARVCPADGKGWAIEQCRDGETCMGGDCVTDQSVCFPGNGSCTDATHGMRCMDNGGGFAMVTCPANTTCTGSGICQGACVVGSSICIDPQHLAVCSDGQTYTTTACDPGKLCVDATVESDVPAAACLPAACTPRADGCDAICANSNASLAFCEATPQGYKLVTVDCPPPTSCNPAGDNSCNGVQAGCTSDCNPGEQRCADDSSYQTCGQDGKWPNAVTQCNPSDTAPRTFCMQSPVDLSQVVCGDAACALGFAGACPQNGDNFIPSVATTQFRACGADGKLGAVSACAGGGLCAPVDFGLLLNFPQSMIDAALLNPPGQCGPVCQPGDQQCNGNNAIQTCGSDNLWNAPSLCSDAGTTGCLGYTSSSGRPAAVCGICVPGSHRCSNSNGDVEADPTQQASNDTFIQTCADDGQSWGTAHACPSAATSCVNLGAEASCVAECIPGSVVCVGPPSTEDGLPDFPGTQFQGICGANGRLPVPSNSPMPSPLPCDPGSMCRRDVRGNALGCVQCVGSTQNEFGLVDTRCADNTGDPLDGDTTLGVQTCASNNTWSVSPAPVACNSVDGNFFCFAATHTLIPTRTDAYCHICSAAGTNGNEIACTDSVLRDVENDTSCDNEGLGAPIPCGGFLAGSAAVPDCCSQFCFVDPNPASAQCGPGGN